MVVDAPRVTVRATGLSLVELLVTVAIISLTAAVAIPAVTSAHTEPPQAALQAITDALRFAREQASLTGIIHGVEIDSVSNQLRVFRVTPLSSPATPEYSVLHPVTRQLYTLTFGAGLYRDVQLQSWQATSSGVCDEMTLLGFDSHGISRCLDPLTVRMNASLEVRYRGADYSVLIEPLSGRISRQ